MAGYDKVDHSEDTAYAGPTSPDQRLTDGYELQATSAPLDVLPGSATETFYDLAQPADARDRHYTAWDRNNMGGTADDSASVASSDAYADRCVWAIPMADVDMDA